MDDFKQAVLVCVRDRFVEFSGRAGRPEFWYFMVACLALNIALSMLYLGVLGTVANLALAVPSAAAGSRRLHDIGKSGWLQLLWFVPVLGWAVMIYWLSQPSAGANAYGDGPAPLAAAAARPSRMR